MLCEEGSNKGLSKVRCNDSWNEGESGKSKNGVRSKEPENEGDNGDLGKGGRICVWSLGTEFATSRSGPKLW